MRTRIATAAALVFCGALSAAAPSRADSGGGAAIVVEVPAFAAQRPALLYRDRDDAARIALRGIVDPGNPGDRMQRLVDVVQAVQDAYQHSLARRMDAMARAYAVAFAGAAGDPFAERFVRWSYGWSLLNLRDPRGALAQWQRARELHGGEPFWYPYTIAVGLWAAGERELALDYFDALARSQPDWVRGSGPRRYIAHWKPYEKSLMRELHTAWRERRKARERDKA